MLTNTRLIRVQWGDCDPAGIVFYPRYFEWFDAGTILLFEKATGLTKIKMLEKYGGAGLALIEAGAKFAVPSQYGDDIEIELRDAAELLSMSGTRTVIEGADAWNPVFDVTPAALIDAIVTERGVILKPDETQMRTLFP